MNQTCKKKKKKLGREKKVQGNNVHVVPCAPVHGSEHERRQKREEETDAVVIRATPIRPVKLPQTSHSLDPKRLRELRREMQVLRSSLRYAHRLHELLVTPAHRQSRYCFMTWIET
jgi:hypothetical protein